MLQNIMPGTEEQLLKEMTTGYVGFDPTADSLHIGSLVPILLLVHLQRAGHKPVALVGGATGMVGDPSGKSEERNLLPEEILFRNQEGVRRQLEKYLDFTPSLPNAAEMVNNYDWFRDMNFLKFIRDTGKHITINYMESENGISFTEFSYQLVQGYDFFWLYTNKNCKLQMGGSDQWGNITTGAELIRRKTGGEAFAFTCPLLTRADGGKFGKTEQGNIWLAPEKTTPYQFYQFWLNSSDEDAEKWLKIFTFLQKEEIAQLTEKHKNEPAARVLQKRLAREVTLFIHGEEELNKAISTTEKLFGKSASDACELSIEDMEGIEGIIKKTFPAEKIYTGIDVVSFLAESGIFPSKGEARKMIINGGVSINRKKVTETGLELNSRWLLHEKYLLVQKGKKNFYLLSVHH
jgi:tyrosyl-tRNA synthetase